MTTDDDWRVNRARLAKGQYLGQHKCVACLMLVRVYDWLPSMLLCARCARQEARAEKAERERDELKVRVASMMESMSMSCEEPPTNCECSGCSYAREKGGDV